MVDQCDPQGVHVAHKEVVILEGPLMSQHVEGQQNGWQDLATGWRDSVFKDPPLL